MMKEEFEKIAGYEVSLEDYNNIIEPMYLASGLNKKDFAETINKKRFALRPVKDIIREMRSLARHIEDTCTHYTDYVAYEHLHEVIEEYMNRKGYIFDGVKLAGHQINTTMKQCCYYPESITIYGFKNYKTIETIKLV